ncbi:MAG: esterase family protein, partial [Corynebacterium casei]|nr:esterase family protein [Corynebacterium casei]
MKLLRNVTALTAAVALSAGVFTLPALAQDGSEAAPQDAVETADTATDAEQDAPAGTEGEQVEVADEVATNTAESDE